MMPLEAHRLEDRILTDPFAGRHRHGIGNHHHDDDDHDKGDDTDGDDNRLGHRYKAELKGFFRFGQRFCERVLERGINRERHLCRRLRVFETDYIHPDLVGPSGRRFSERFVQVLPLKKELRFIGRFFGPAVDAAHDKLPGAGIYGPLERNGVTDFPAEALCQLFSDHAPFSIQKKCPFFLRRQDKFRIERQVTRRFDGKAGEEILFRDVHPAEPGGV